METTVQSANTSSAARHVPPSDGCTPCFDRGVARRSVYRVGREGWCEECFKGVRGRPKAMVEERKKKMPRLVVLHTEISKHRNHSLDSTKKLVEPFMEKIDIRRCMSCGVDVDKGSKRLCANCRRLMTLVTGIKSWLKSYRKSGDTRMLQNAVAKIRQFGLVPEDFEWL